MNFKVRITLTTIFYLSHKSLGGKIPKPKLKWERLNDKFLCVLVLYLEWSGGSGLIAMLKKYIITPIHNLILSRVDVGVRKGVEVDVRVETLDVGVGVGNLGIEVGVALGLRWGKGWGRG